MFLCVLQEQMGDTYIFLMFYFFNDHGRFNSEIERKRETLFSHFSFFEGTLIFKKYENNNFVMLKSLV